MHLKVGQAISARELELAGYRKQSRLGVASGGTGMDHVVTYINPDEDAGSCVFWRWEKDPLAQQGSIVKLQSRAEYEREWARKRDALLGARRGD